MNSEQTRSCSVLATHDVLHNKTMGRLKSALVFTSFVGLAFSFVVLGVTFVNVERLLGTDVQTMSWVVFAQGAGSVAGSLLCSLVLDLLAKEGQFATASVLQGIFIAVAPFPRSVPVFAVCIALAGVAQGFINAGVNAYAVELWSGARFYRPLMQAVHCVWTLAALIAPLIIQPFIVSLDGPGNSTQLMPMNETTTTTAMEQDVELVRYAYLLVGCIPIVPGIFYIIILCKSYFTKDSPRKTPSKSARLVEAVSVKHTLKVMMFLAPCMFILGAQESHVINFSSSFVVDHLGWDTRRSPLLITTFMTAMFVGRLINIPLALCVAPRSILLINAATTSAFFLLLCFVGHHSVIVWISVVGLGLFHSSTFSTVFLWASSEIRVRGKVAGALAFSESVAPLVTSPLYGFFFQTNEHMYTVYLITLLSVTQFVLFCVLFKFVASSSSDDVDFVEVDLKDMAPTEDKTQC